MKQVLISTDSIISRYSDYAPLMSMLQDVTLHAHLCICVHLMSTDVSDTHLEVAWSQVRPSEGLLAWAGLPPVVAWGAVAGWAWVSAATKRMMIIRIMLTKVISISPLAAEF